jgi:sec-independent protein translocase protein TatA
MLGLFGNTGLGEMLLLAFLGLLIFGKRLPEVGRSLGKGILEFKKGLSGIEDDAQQSPRPTAEAPQPPRQLESPRATDIAKEQPLATPEIKTPHAS